MCDRRCVSSTVLLCVRACVSVCTSSNLIPGGSAGISIIRGSSGAPLSPTNWGLTSSSLHSFTPSRPSHPSVVLAASLSPSSGKFRPPPPSPSFFSTSLFPPHYLSLFTPSLFPLSSTPLFLFPTLLLLLQPPPPPFLPPLHFSNSPSSLFSPPPALTPSFPPSPPPPLPPERLTVTWLGALRGRVISMLSCAACSKGSNILTSATSQIDGRTKGEEGAACKFLWHSFAALVERFLLSATALCVFAADDGHWRLHGCQTKCALFFTAL